MPIPFLADVVFGEVKWLPDVRKILVVVVVGAVVAAVKRYCMGAYNLSERQMHSKVIMVTGGTTGIGAAVVEDLAKRGAQVILLVHHSPTDAFLNDYIEDMRERTGNELIYAEQMDLSSLYSIRKFATKWIDNAPPRRLDMIILCAATFTPPGKSRVVTEEGIEEAWMVNYLANFHLLSILSPALRIQPPDRDVRILIATCPSYIRSPPLGDCEDALKVSEWSPSKAYARSKLAMTIFGQALQKHLDAYKRPDGAPMNTRVIFVDPGYTRTAGMRRWLTRGTLWGLALYLVLWQNVWMFLKSANGGAQSFLYAAMEASLGRGQGGKFIKECRELDFARIDIKNDEVAKKLWESSEKLIERAEREDAVRRAYEKAQKAGSENKGSNRGENSTEAMASGTDTKKTKSRRQRKTAK